MGEENVRSKEVLLKERLHVVLFPFPAQGHTIPALMLAQRLIRGGIAVSLVIFQDRLRRLHEALDGFGMVCDGYLLTVETLPSGRAPPETWNETGHDNPEAVILMARQCYEVKDDFEKLVIKLKTSAAAAAAAGLVSRWSIVSDTVLGWTQDVANNLAIPRYVFYPSPASVLAGVFYVKVLKSEGRLPLKSSDPDELVHIPGLPPIRTQDMHNYLQDSVSKLAHEFYVNCCLRCHEAAGVFINSSEQLEPVALKALKTNPALNRNSVRIFPVGPLLPATELQIARAHQLLNREEKSLVWLNQQPARSVIFVSFGSIVVLSEKQIEEIARGLVASGQKFLWVLRAEGGRNVQYEEMFSDEKQGLVMQNEWAPQLQILAHESTGAFFTHCGWNSTIESLSHGVPMLASSFFGDQALNARLVVEELGVGLRIESFESSRVEICVKRLLDPSSGFRDRAEALKISAAGCSPTFASMLETR